jgi:hypothetical protein
MGSYQAGGIAALQRFRDELARDRLLVESSEDPPVTVVLRLLELCIEKMEAERGH